MNNKVVKKTVYVKLAARLINIDTTRFVLKTKYDKDKSSLEIKISDVGKKIPNINKHSNCPDFAGTVTVFDMLSRCPALNQFVTGFRFLTKNFS